MDSRDANEAFGMTVLGIPSRMKSACADQFSDSIQRPMRRHLLAARRVRKIPGVSESPANAARCNTIASLCRLPDTHVLLHRYAPLFTITKEESPIK